MPLNDWNEPTVFQLKKNSADFAFANLFLNAFKVFAILVILAILQINIVKPMEQNFEMKAEASVMMEWPIESTCDVDLYVKSPTGTIVYFGMKNDGPLNLEKDDRGHMYDKIILPTGQEIMNPENVEYWIMRNAVPGDYTVNVHTYSCPPDQLDLIPGASSSMGYSAGFIAAINANLRGPLKVRVKLTKFNPVFQEIIPWTEIEFTRANQEKLAFHFTVKIVDGKPVFEFKPSKLYVPMAHKNQGN
jgi:hypothetical protein